MKIALYGHFGTPNTGNESTLIAMLSSLRGRLPDSTFFCICTNPEAVIARDGIDAVPITTSAVRIWNRQARLDSRVRSAFIQVSARLMQYIHAFKALEGTGMLIISGTGLLTDAYGVGGWGPSNIFKWSLMAKLRGCKVAFVSVGAGPIYSAPGRFLVKSALFLADYRSYRDDSSLNYLKSIGFRTTHDQVYPDLAFSLPRALLPPSEGRAERTRIVGLGLMSYAGRYSVESPRDETYTSYLKALATFTEWLLAHDYDVRLLFGDAEGDTVAVQEFKEVLRPRLEPHEEERVIDEPITSVQHLLAQLSATDIVVATRFHNVLLSLVLNKPVIAVSFHHKSDSLMNSMGLTEYRHDINCMNADMLIDQFQNLENNVASIKSLVRQRVEESRTLLDEQYDLLVKDL